MIWYTGIKWIDIVLFIFYAALGLATLASLLGEKTSSGLEDKTGPDF